MKKTEILSLFLLFVALFGLFAFTVHREMAGKEVITVIRTGGEGTVPAKETVTNIRKPLELHYDVFGAYAGTALVCLGTMFFWMRRFLEAVSKTADDNLSELLRSGLLLIGGAFFAIIGLFLVAVMIVLL